MKNQQSRSRLRLKVKQLETIPVTKSCRFRVLGSRFFDKKRSDSFLSKRRDQKMIRPLLDLKRESITMICKDFSIPVYPDKSNSLLQYSRNRIRKQVIPSIKYFFNPQVETSLFKIAELLNREQLLVNSLLKNTL